MKKLLIAILVIAFYNAHAQDSLKVLNYDREHIKKTGMEVLGSWAVAHIAVGTIESNRTTGSAHYLYQMDALWNIVNLGAAVSGYISATNNSNKSFSAADALLEQRKIEKIFLINGGLDLVYMGGGVYLNHRGNADNSDKLRGYGSSIILQGAFLFLFDATMYTSERNNGNKLRHFLEKNAVIFDGKKLGMIIKL